MRQKKSSSRKSSTSVFFKELSASPEQTIPEALWKDRAKIGSAYKNLPRLDPKLYRIFGKSIEEHRIELEKDKSVFKFFRHSFVRYYLYSFDQETPIYQAIKLLGHDLALKGFLTIAGEECVQLTGLRECEGVLYANHLAKHFGLSPNKVVTNLGWPSHHSVLNIIKSEFGGSTFSKHGGFASFQMLNGAGPRIPYTNITPIGLHATTISFIRDHQQVHAILLNGSCSKTYSQTAQLSEPIPSTLQFKRNPRANAIRVFSFHVTEKDANKTGLAIWALIKELSQATNFDNDTRFDGLKLDKLIRKYQSHLNQELSKKLSCPPQKVGNCAFYSAIHSVRLFLIAQEMTKSNIPLADAIEPTKEQYILFRLKCKFASVLHLLKLVKFEFLVKDEELHTVFDALLKKKFMRARDNIGVFRQLMEEHKVADIYFERLLTPRKSSLASYFQRG